VLVLEAIGAGLAAAAGTAWVALRIGPGRIRAVDRLRQSPPVVSGFLPSPGLVWRELVAWAGAMVPAAPRNLPLLKRRLVRAGFRNPQAARLFHGARACTTVACGVAGLVIGLHVYATADRLLLATVCGALIGYMAPMQYLVWRIRSRKRAVEKGLPDVLDLMVVCVESGLGLDQTVIQVAKELQAARPEICEEFTVMNLELRAGKPRLEALHNLAERTGVDDVKKLVAVLIQTDRFGTSIAQSLRGHADYLRVMARQRAEEKAAKLAVKLVFPIFFCVLPSLFVVTIGPVITRLVRDLFPMIENM
jgi:tight adherence protein C